MRCSLLIGRVRCGREMGNDATYLDAQASGGKEDAAASRRFMHADLCALFYSVDLLVQSRPPFVFDLRPHPRRAGHRGELY